MINENNFLSIIQTNCWEKEKNTNKTILNENRLNHVRVGIIFAGDNVSCCVVWSHPLSLVTGPKRPQECFVLRRWINACFLSKNKLHVNSTCSTWLSINLCWPPIPNYPKIKHSHRYRFYFLGLIEESKLYAHAINQP